MQKIKNHLKNIGKKLQESGVEHQESLRRKLLALHPQAPIMSSRRFAWLPVFSWGACAIIFVLIGVKFYHQPSVIQEYQINEYAEDGSMVDSFGLVADAENDLVTITEPTTIRTKGIKDEDVVPYGKIVDYEEQNGTMLEQTVSVRMLTQDTDASETVAALFASLGGHLSLIRTDDAAYTNIAGLIPTSRISFFYERLDTLVKNDAFIEKTIVGESVTSQAIDLADREQALRDAEAGVTEQLRAANTDEQKKMLQESLETISNEMVQLAQEQDALDDRFEYATVSVHIEKLPSLWGVENERQLTRCVAGFESPTVWQRVVINVLTVFFVALQLVSMTFWILIPLGIFIIVHLRRRRMLRALD